MDFYEVIKYVYSYIYYILSQWRGEEMFSAISSVSDPNKRFVKERRLCGHIPERIGS